MWNFRVKRKSWVLVSWTIPCLSSSLLPLSSLPQRPRVRGSRARAPPPPPRTPVPNWGSVTFGLAPSDLQGCTTSSPTKKFLSHFPSDVLWTRQTIQSTFVNLLQHLPLKKHHHTTLPRTRPSWPASPTRPASTSSGPLPSSANLKTRKSSPRYIPPLPPITTTPKANPPFPGRNPLPRHQALRPRTHHPLPRRQALRLPRLRRLGALPRPAAHQAVRAPAHPPIHLARQPRPHLFHL